MEEQSFALMLRQVLTEYDFAGIDVSSERANVVLKREVYTANSKGEVVEFSFSNPVLIKVIEELKAYLPAM